MGRAVEDGKQITRWRREKELRNDDGLDTSARGEMKTERLPATERESSKKA
jgi:hypothetical protein